MSTFLVTGAAGFIGSHSVDRLLAEGHQVIGLDNLRTGKRENLADADVSAAFRFVDADVNDTEILREIFLCQQITGVLHLAALVSVPESYEKPEENYFINLAAADLLARMCIEYRCKRLVFASSAAVYGTVAELPCRETMLRQPQSPYAAAKAAAELMLLGYGASYDLQAICLRYFNVYGLRQDPGSPYSGVLSIFTERFATGQPITIYGDGEQSRDFISVEDVARINCEALLHPAPTTGSAIINVCTGDAVSLNQVLNIYRELFGNAPAISYGQERIGDIRHSLGDPTQMQKLLETRAELSIKQGLQTLCENILQTP